MILKKIFFKLNTAFGKTMKNLRKHRDIELVTTGRRRNCLVSEPNYYTENFFTVHRTSFSKKNKKTQILINKPVYLGLSILELSKILIYEFCHYYVEPKYCENAKLCYMDTDTFIVYLKKVDI